MRLRRTLVSWARPLAGALVLLVGLTFAAPPVAAEPPAASAPRTLAAAVSAKVAAMPLPPRTRAQVAPSPIAPRGDGKGFFKSPAGVAAIVLMTAGTGYMVYSAFRDNDAVHSPFR